MAGKNRRGEPPVQGDAPTKQDEADIVQEMEATADNDIGELTVDEEKAREAGAVDAASIRENRYVRDTLDKKRGGGKRIPFNVENALLKHEGLTRLWPPNTLDIIATRRTGSPIVRTIISRPKTGTELYEALMQQVHGQHPEAEYELKWLDMTTKEIRGNARITLPSTLAPGPMTPPQGQLPMNPYYPTPPYGAPPQQYQQQPGYPQQQPPPAIQQQPVAAPVMPGMPAGMDFNAFLALQKQQFEMWQSARGGVAPQAVAAAPVAAMPVMPQPTAGMDINAFLALQKQQFEMWQTAQAHGAHPQAAVAPAVPAAAPAPGMDFNAFLALQRQQFEMWQAAQAAGAQQVAPARGHYPQQQQSAMNPAMMGMPPFQPPPGMMFVPGFGFVPVEQLFHALSGGPQGPRGPYRGPYPGGGGGYGPSYGPGAPGGPGGYPPPHAPARPKTAAEEFRDAVTIVDQAINLADRFRPPTQQTTDDKDEDDSPVKVIDAGPAKLVLNSKDGSARYWETGWANMDKVLKWVGEQREAIQKAGAERDSRQRQRQPLPPGYVEVTPGYQPPPGYVAVPVDPSQVPGAAPQQQLPAPPPQQQPLPPPPPQMPPPIQPAQPVSGGGQSGKRTWGAPPIPGGGG